MMLKPYVRSNNDGVLTGPVQYLRCTPVNKYFVPIQKVPCSATVQMRNLNLTEVQVDAMLGMMDTSDLENGTIDLRGNAAPTAVGEASKTSLEGKGWKVYVAEADVVVLRARAEEATKAAKSKTVKKNGKGKKNGDDESTAVD